jgi:hypothetical protein
MLRRLKTRLIRALARANDPLEQRLDDLALLVGAGEAARVRGDGVVLRDAEFRVFSQWGEDGIIQWLLARVDVDADAFVEIGAGDYREANTRFLLEHDNWRGVVVDAGTAHREFADARRLRWRHTLDVVSAFVTRENVAQIVRDADLSAGVGLLSIDLDGNDYWVLEAVLQEVRPSIVVCEYNSVFGRDRAVTVPYDPAFTRDGAHASLLYYGASLPALAHLLGAADYALVGCNRAGNDAFFVRRELAADVVERPVADAYVASRFRESTGPGGEHTYVSDHRARLEAIGALPLVDVASGARGTVASLLLP